MKRKSPFYLDKSQSNPHMFLIRVDVAAIPFKYTLGSLSVLPARIMNLSYAQYLRFCRDIVLGEIRGKGNLYPVPYFKQNKLTNQFVKLLNKRAEYIIWEKDNPDFDEHMQALIEFRNLKKEEN